MPAMMQTVAASLISFASGADRLYYSTMNSPRSITSLDLTGGDATTIVRPSEFAACFGVDPATGTMFWVESKSRVLWRAPYGADRNDAEIAINDMGSAQMTSDGGMGYPHCTFSTVGGSLSKIYWSHGKELKWIKSATVTLTGEFTDVTEITTASIPGHVLYSELSDGSSKLFWSDQRSSSTNGNSADDRGIYMSDPDGSNQKQIVRGDGMSLVNDMSLVQETAGDYLYFVNSGSTKAPLARVRITDGMVAQAIDGLGLVAAGTKSGLKTLACKGPDADASYVRCYVGDGGLSPKIWSFSAGGSDFQEWYEGIANGYTDMKFLDINIPTTVTSTKITTTITTTVTSTVITITNTTTTATNTTVTTTATTTNNVGVSNDAKALIPISVFRASFFFAFLLKLTMLA